MVQGRKACGGPKTADRRGMSRACKTGCGKLALHNDLCHACSDAQAQWQREMRQASRDEQREASSAKQATRRNVVVRPRSSAGTVLRPSRTVEVRHFEVTPNFMAYEAAKMGTCVCDLAARKFGLASAGTCVCDAGARLMDAKCLCDLLRKAKAEWSTWPAWEQQHQPLELPLDGLVEVSSMRTKEGGDGDCAWFDVETTYECRSCATLYLDKQTMAGGRAGFVPTARQWQVTTRAAVAAAAHHARNRAPTGVELVWSGVGEYVRWSVGAVAETGKAAASSLGSGVAVWSRQSDVR
jgi:hypothetical protein